MFIFVMIYIVDLKKKDLMVAMMKADLEKKVKGESALGEK